MGTPARRHLLLFQAMLSRDRTARMPRALDALDGLSVRDAFGERFFVAPGRQ
jgi:hypothetical protein